MRVYRVSGMTCGGCEKAVLQAIRKRLGDKLAVEADARAGEVRVDGAADPDGVARAIESAGYTVEKGTG